MGAEVVSSLNKWRSGGVGVCDKGEVKWDRMCKGAGDDRERSRVVEERVKREWEGSG